MRYLLIAFVVFLSFTTGIAAQDGELNQNIPACTSEEATLATELITDVSEDFAQLGSRAEDINTQTEVQAALPGLIRDYDILQKHWWNEIYPQLPECSFALNWSLRVGRVLDDSLVTLSLVYITTNGTVPEAEINTMLKESLQERLIDLRDQQAAFEELAH